MIAALTAAWSWFVGTKVGRWIVELMAILAGLGAALGYVYFKGKRAQADTDEAKDAEADAKAAQEAAEYTQRSTDAVRQTHVEVSQMQDAGTQRIRDAADNTAAGWLRHNADRDQAGP